VRTPSNYVRRNWRAPGWRKRDEERSAQQVRDEVRGKRRGTVIQAPRFEPDSLRDIERD